MSGSTLILVVGCSARLFGTLRVGLGGSNGGIPYTSGVVLQFVVVFHVDCISVILFRISVEWGPGCHPNSSVGNGSSMGRIFGVVVVVCFLRGARSHVGRACPPLLPRMNRTALFTKTWEGRSQPEA